MKELINENLNIQGMEVKEEWIIKDDLTADWAIDKIKEIDEEYKRFEDVAMQKIKQIQDAMNKQKEAAANERSYFEYKLREYMGTVKTKETKTQKIYSLPSGKLVIKKDKQDFEVDKIKLLEYVKENDMFELIKVKEELKWSDMKKELSIQDGYIVVNDTGEILEIEGLKVVNKPGKFEIK